MPYIDRTHGRFVASPIILHTIPIDGTQLALSDSLDMTIGQRRMNTELG
jgi:hypothetical protein